MKVNRSLIVILLAVLLAGSAFLTLTMIDFDSTPPLDGGYNLTVIDREKNEHTFSLNDLVHFPKAEGFSSYENQFNNWRGYGYYRGFNLIDLINEVGGMSEHGYLTFEASDDYSINISYANIFPNETTYTFQGSCVLAYSFNSSYPPDWDEGYRLVFLPEDEGFSNDDLINSTNLIDYSAGSLWIQKVVKIFIN
ncbi:MAG: molybdopterin-dependent oxidoreductase [Candidatus Heimdallarchaeota archaeon]|nr:molybdopterin-dependent oxidoreductase [Candidatus Heimdallarchaeota archaeon]MCK5049718.1 molybdopterin-dependent oxidoreductase [Candidatus Heimdallarchaeota archaeon]